MIDTNLIKLIQKIETNPQYNKIIQKCKTRKELYDYCHSLSGGYSPEEFDKLMYTVTILSQLTSKKDVLSEKQLTSISGGISRKEIQKIKNTLDTAVWLTSFTNKFSKIADTVYFNDINNMSTSELHQMMEEIMDGCGLQ